MSNTKAELHNKTNPLRKIYYWTLKHCEKPYADVFLSAFSFFESIFIPIPTDPLLLARASAAPQKALWTAAYVSFFSVLGGAAGYFIGFHFWDSFSPFVYTYIFPENIFQTVQARMVNNTFLFVLLGGFTPLPFKAFVLSAGFLQLPFLPFLAGSLVGRGLRFMLLGGLIFFFGDSIQGFINKHLERLFLVSGLLVGILFLYKVL